jgi:hypothetical protein
MSASISSVGAGQAAGAMQRPPRPDMAKALAPVADALGLDAAELKAELKGGASLDDLAQTRGVSHEDLLAAIKEGLAEVGPPVGAGAVDQARLDAMAEEIAGRSGAERPAGPGPGGPPPPPRVAGDETVQASLARVADLFDMDTDELLTQLQSTTLADLASSRQVGADELLGAFGRQLDGYM